MHFTRARFAYGTATVVSIPRTAADPHRVQAPSSARASRPAFVGAVEFDRGPRLRVRADGRLDEGLRDKDRCGDDEDERTLRRITLMDINISCDM